jgi:SAM-dependent methyltransferase
VAPPARYDGLANDHEAFQQLHADYYKLAESALRELLGSAPGRCLDVGCGTGRFLRTLLALEWTPVGVDISDDQLRIAREHAQRAELVRCNAAALPFEDESFDAAISMFTHTDLDDFAGAIREARRVLKSGARLVYVGNHPCFVGSTQEHVDTGVPVLHPGYRRSGRWSASEAPGATPGGWRVQLGSFVHLPLSEFLTDFAGWVILEVRELDDGWEYPKTVAVAVSKP